MIVDNNLEIADAVALTVTASTTYVVGDVVPLTAVRDIGAGQPVYLVVSLASSLISNTTTASTLTLQIAKSASSDLGTPTVMVRSMEIAVPASTAAALQAGTVLWVVQIPQETLGAASPYTEFLGLRVVNGGQAISNNGDDPDAAINAVITPTPPQWKAYADAVN